MRAMAGRISGVANWEAKKLLARHIWLDAEHADAIRQRVLELRYPRVDVDCEVDGALAAVLVKLPSTRSDAEFLLGVYRVIKPAVLEAVQRYLEQSDRLDDAPSHRALRRVVEELSDQVHEFAAIWGAFPEEERAEAAPWEAWLREAVKEAGGILGPDSGLPLLAHACFSDRPRYVIPKLPKRDPRWLPAITQVPPRPPRTPQEQQVWVAIDHVNELWACELSGAFIWHYHNFPWELYRETARWAYDEMRHAMMGERRLLAWGFEVGVDVPMVPEWVTETPSGNRAVKFGRFPADWERAAACRRHVRSVVERRPSHGSRHDRDLDTLLVTRAVEGPAIVSVRALSNPELRETSVRPPGGCRGDAGRRPAEIRPPHPSLVSLSVLESGSRATASDGDATGGSSRNSPRELFGDVVRRE
jgi:hypothetical protein